MYDEICADYESDDLVVSYIKTAESACERFTNHLKPDKLRSLFALIGARDVAINLGKVEEQLQITDSPPRSFSPNVRWLVELIHRLSPTLHKDTAKLAIQILARLSIDFSVAKDTQLRILIEQTLDRLINSFAEQASVSILQEIACTLFNSIKHPTLRSRLVESLPLSSNRSHYFRRHVALAFALDKTPNYGSTFDNLALYSHMILFLENCKELKIRSSTDYTLVTAIIKLVDVAIDDGFARPTTIAAAATAAADGTSNTTSSGSETDAAQRKAANFFKPRKRISKPIISDAEKQFNHSIDKLVYTLEKIRDRIVTTGATHISRLEARSAIERLLQRLQFAVRTRAVERRDWYRNNGSGSGNDVMQGQLGEDGSVTTVDVRNSAIMDVDD